MLILQIASGDFFSTYGGGQVYVKNIVDEMIRQQCDVQVLSFVDRNCGVEEKAYKGIKLYEIGKQGEVEIPALIEKIHPDIIHVHSHKAQIAKIGKSLGIPVVVTAHHGGIVCPAGTLMDCQNRICLRKVSHKDCLPCVLRNTRGGLAVYPLLRLLPCKLYLRLGNLLQKLPFVYFLTPLGSAAKYIQSKWNEWQDIVEYSSRIIAPCHKIAEAMEVNGLPNEKITVLPHGIPLPKEVPAFPTVENGKVKFYYLGRICYVKGLHILLEAFHRLENPHVEMHLIGGSGNKKEYEYEQMLKKRYANDARIIWHGKVNPEEVFHEISAYHVSSSSSYMEIFGLNIAESLAMGKPVLATRCGGAEMQIVDDENGWLVPANDVEAMSKKMQEITETLADYDTAKSTQKVIPIKEHVESLNKLYEEVTH